MRVQNEIRCILQPSLHGTLCKCKCWGPKDQFEPTYVLHWSQLVLPPECPLDGGGSRLGDLSPAVFVLQHLDVSEDEVLTQLVRLRGRQGGCGGRGWMVTSMAAVMMGLVMVDPVHPVAMAVSRLVAHSHTG